MGADVSKIKVLKAVIEDGEEAFFNLTRHLSALEEAVIATSDTQLVIIDPISAYLGNTDSHVNAQVRGAFAPLAMLAEKYGIAVIGISHLNKNQQASLIYRTIGSIAFTAAARAVWLVTEDKNDEDRRLLLTIKTNLSKKPSGLAFTLVDGSIEFEPGDVYFTASEMVEARPDSKTPALDTAVDWLSTTLAGGSVPATEIVDRAWDEADIRFDTLFRAKKKLNVRSEIRTEDGRRASYWVLPNKTE